MNRIQDWSGTGADERDTDRRRGKEVAEVSPAPSVAPLNSGRGWRAVGEIAERPLFGVTLRSPYRLLAQRPEDRRESKMPVSLPDITVVTIDTAAPDPLREAKDAPFTA
jgi:hypothetical protein